MQRSTIERAVRLGGLELPEAVDIEVGRFFAREDDVEIPVRLLRERRDALAYPRSRTCARNDDRNARFKRHRPSV